MATLSKLEVVSLIEDLDTATSSINRVRASSLRLLELIENEEV
jgi:hypothetical protein